MNKRLVFSFLILLVSVSAFAMIDSTGRDKAISNDFEVQITSLNDMSGYNDVKMYQKHREIDRYVFTDHKREIEEYGFTVTHTGPVDGVIEIGITPYNEQNAEFLYKAFGRNDVKVVEGAQAVLYAAPHEDDAIVTTIALQDGTITPDKLQKQQEIDQYLFVDHAEDLAARGIKVTYTAPVGDVIEIGIKPYNENNAAYLESIFGKGNIQVVAGTEAVHYTVNPEAQMEVTAVNAGVDFSWQSLFSVLTGTTLILALIYNLRKIKVVEA